MMMIMMIFRRQYVCTYRQGCYLVTALRFSHIFFWSGYFEGNRYGKSFVTQDLIIFIFVYDFRRSNKKHLLICVIHVTLPIITILFVIVKIREPTFVRGPWADDCRIFHYSN